MSYALGLVRGACAVLIGGHPDRAGRMQVLDDALLGPRRYFARIGEM
jgi:hypothetical protein